MKKYLLLLLIVAKLGNSFAQQEAQLSMYMFNMLQYNPAYAGSKECPNAVAVYRHQWQGIESSPRSLSLNFHTPLAKEQYALGASLRGDKLGQTKFVNMEGSFAYRLKLKDDLKLSLGVSAGMTYYELDFSKQRAEGNPDPKFASNPNKILPNFGVGLYLYSPKYYVGLSMPHFIANSLLEQKNATIADSAAASQSNHIYATGGVILGKSDIIKFRPSFFLKYVNGAPLSVDLNFSVLLKERFWIGASYRFGGDIYDFNTGKGKFGSGNAIIAFFKVLITPKFELGYAYDYSLSKLNTGTSGTHELMLGMTLCKNKNIRYVTPRYVNYF